MTRKEIDDLIFRFQGHPCCHIDRTVQNPVVSCLLTACGHDPYKAYTISYDYPLNQRGVNPETLRSNDGKV